MPGTKVVEDIELIIEDIGRGGGNPPPPGGHGGGDGDGSGNQRRRPAPYRAERHRTAIILGMVSIFMFFSNPDLSA